MGGMVTEWWAVKGPVPCQRRDAPGSRKPESLLSSWVLTKSLVSEQKSSSEYFELCQEALPKHCATPFALGTLLAVGK